jgi:hypothetical protein
MNNDEIIYLAFQEGTDLDTDQNPEIRTSPSPGLKDLAGTELTEITSEDITEQDGAGPVLIIIEGNNDQLLLVFSEPVQSLSGAGGIFQTADFTYYENFYGLGASAISSVSGVNNYNTQVIVTLNSSLALEDYEFDRLSVADMMVGDLSGNPAPVVAEDFNREGMIFKKIAISSETLGHACGLTYRGRLKCWGYKVATGLGDYDDLGVSGDWGDETGEMENLPVLDLGTVNGDDTGGPLLVMDFDVGPNLTCVKLHIKRVKCWGRNDVGQLISDGVYSPSGDTSWGDDPNEMGDFIPYVNLGTVNGDGTGGDLIVSIMSISDEHMCAITQINRLKCWGKGNYGQLGLEDQVDPGTDGYWGNQAGEQGDVLPNIDLGSVNGDGTGGDLTPVKISVSLYHSCTMFSTGLMKCFGRSGSGYGEVGLGDYTPPSGSQWGDDNGEMGDNLPYLDVGSILTITDIESTSGISCGILSNNMIKCWGYSLIYGTDSVIGDNTSEMGDNLDFIDLGSY